MIQPALRVRIANYYTLRHELQRFQEIERGAFTTYVLEVLNGLRDYAEDVTHQQTGTLARSHVVDYDSRHQRGEIHPDPSFVKPPMGRQGRTQSVEDYAGYEHARGGEHAFYERALHEYGNVVVMRGTAAYLGRMPGGIHQ